jgi:gamma-glutamyltranspeptidase/glutathione hydrolase
MPRSTRRAVSTLLVVNLFAAVMLAQTGTQTATPSAPVTAQHAMVVTIHHDATDAGVEVLREGGNAVDAALAAAGLC